MKPAPAKTTNPILIDQVQFRVGAIPSELKIVYEYKYSHKGTSCQNTF